MQNSLVWWCISSQISGTCSTNVEKWTMTKLSANDKWLTSWPNQSRTGIFLSPAFLVAVGKDRSGKRPVPVADVFSASSPKELWMYPLRMCTFWPFWIKSSIFQTNLRLQSEQSTSAIGSFRLLIATLLCSQRSENAWVFSLFKKSNVSWACLSGFEVS